jgi:prepilin-type N-terminal cleavage/methylation domain-containing protein
MKLRKHIRNQKGFTLIEIIAVLVILGILAAIAIPKYLDMRKDAVVKAAAAATMELNARERLTLAQYKLKDGAGVYPVPGSVSAAFADGSVVSGISMTLGPDWNAGAPLAYTADNVGIPITFSGKTVTFTRNLTGNAPDDPNNEPAYWSVSVTD